MAMYNQHFPETRIMLQPKSRGPKVTPFPQRKDRFNPLVGGKRQGGTTADLPAERPATRLQIGSHLHRIGWANFSSTGVQKDGSRMALIDTNILPHATGERSNADAPNSVGGCAQPLRTRNSRGNHDAGFLRHATEPKCFGARRVTDRFVPRERQGQRP
jgi:hypothetical protein